MLPEFAIKLVEICYKYANFYNQLHHQISILKTFCTEIEVRENLSPICKFITRSDMKVTENRE